MTRRVHQYGLTYIVMLCVVATLSYGLTRFSSMWSTNVQREREAELLFIGSEFVRALASYKAAQPDDPAPGPASLEDLILDPRVPFVRRHLRRLYRDPMTGAPDWILERQEGRIVGVRSRSLRPVLRSANLPAWVGLLNKAGQGTRYTDWVFRLATSKPTYATPSARYHGGP